MGNRPSGRVLTRSVENEKSEKRPLEDCEEEEKEEAQGSIPSSGSKGPGAKNGKKNLKKAKKNNSEAKDDTGETPSEVEKEAPGKKFVTPIPNSSATPGPSTSDTSAQSAQSVKPVGLAQRIISVDTNPKPQRACFGGASQFSAPAAPAAPATATTTAAPSSTALLPGELRRELDNPVTARVISRALSPNDPWEFEEEEEEDEGERASAPAGVSGGVSANGGVNPSATQGASANVVGGTGGGPPYNGELLSKAQVLRYYQLSSPKAFFPLGEKRSIYNCIAKNPHNGSTWATVRIDTQLESVDPSTGLPKHYTYDIPINILPKVSQYCRILYKLLNPTAEALNDYIRENNLNAQQIT